MVKTSDLGLPIGLDLVIEPPWGGTQKRTSGQDAFIVLEFDGENKVKQVYLVNQDKNGLPINYELASKQEIRGTTTEKPIEELGESLPSLGVEPRGERVLGLVNDLQSKDPIVSSNARRSLITLGEVGVPALIDALENPEFKDKEEVVLTLRGIGQKAERAVPDLVKLLDNPSLRSEAESILQSIVGPVTVSALAEVIKDPKKDLEVKNSAIKILGNLGVGVSFLFEGVPQELDLIIPDLIKLLDNPSLKSETEKTLKVIKRDSTVSALAEVIKDPKKDLELKRSAMKILLSFGSEAKTSVPTLIEVVETSDDEELRGAAIRALGNVVGGIERLSASQEDKVLAKGILDALIKALDERNYLLRISVVEALGKMQGAEDVSIALNEVSLRDPHSLVRSSAVRAQTNLKWPSFEEIMSARARSKVLSPAERINLAREVLEEISGKVRTDELLSDKKILEGIEDIHQIGTREGRGIGTYTPLDKLRKARGLRRLGFKFKEIRGLMQKGVFGEEALVIGEVSAELPFEELEESAPIGLLRKWPGIFVNFVRGRFGREETKLFEIRQSERYQKQLEQTYSAVVLDIDGTITDPETGRVPLEILEKVYDLLRRGYPVILITGRASGGRGGANGVFEQIRIIHRAKGGERSHEGEKELEFIQRNFLVFVENGAEGFSVDKKAYSYKIDKPEGLELLESSLIGLVGEVAKVNKKKFSLQLNFESPEQLETSLVRVRELISNLGLSFNVVRSGDRILDILPFGVDKGIALSKGLEYLGINSDKVLKVGDNGQRGGNDYPLLSSFGGFSVGKYDEESVLPVVDERGRKLEGPEAVLWLLNNLKLDFGGPVTRGRIKEIFSDELKTNTDLEGLLQKGELEEKIFGNDPRIDGMFGETSHKRILEEIYPVITDSLRGKSIEDLFDTFVGLGASTEGLENILEQYEGKEWPIKTDPKKDGRKLEEDVRGLANDLERVMTKYGSKTVISYEKDMDVISTGLEETFSRKEGLNVKRAILSRRSFGEEGEYTPLYSSMLQIMENAKQDAEVLAARGDERVEIFRKKVIKDIQELHKTNPEFREQMDRIYAEHIEPIVGKGENVVFADVGQRGVMQFFSAAMYELNNKGKTAVVYLVHLRKPTESYSFQEFIFAYTESLDITTSQKDKLFGRHNRDSIYRLLVDVPGGNRAVRTILHDQDLLKLFEALIRLKHGQLAATPPPT